MNVGRLRPAFFLGDLMAIGDTALIQRANAGDLPSVLELARLLSEQGDVDAVHWLSKAADAGFGEAVAEMGLWKIVGHMMPVDTVAGASLLKQASKAGYVKANLLLATARAQGEGEPASFPEAIRSLIRAAKNGEASALRQLAFLLKPLPRFDGLRQTLYFQAARQGDAIACYFLGKILCASSEEVDRKQGRGWLKAASERGGWCATRQLNEMIGEKMIAPQVLDEVTVPWRDLPRYLDLPHDRKVPPETRLQVSPKVSEIKNFFTPEEADYVISAGEAFLAQATVNDEKLGQVEDDSRTNSFANFHFMESDVVLASLNARLVKYAGLTGKGGDPLSLLHYQVGQSYAPHYDFFDPSFPAHKAPLQEGGQRTKTMLVYLNDDYQGGETDFPEIDFRYRGTKGGLLLFDNVNEQGEPDRRTLHTGCAPTSGEKWLLSKWIRQRNIG